MTEVKIGDQVLSVEETVISITKRNTPLPDSLDGSKGGIVEIVTDEISAAADRYLRDSPAGKQTNQRPGVAESGTQRNGPKAIPVTITQNGNRAFAGELIYQSSSITNPGNPGLNGRRDAFEMTGDGYVLWPQLEGVSLRDIDLGTIEWGRTAAEESWAGGVDDGWRAIFAPVIYGKSPYDTEGQLPTGRFTNLEVRPHIYFYWIVKAIFAHVGYTIESAFVESAMFKECVHTFGAGEAMEVITTAQTDNSVFARINSPINRQDTQIIEFDAGASAPDVGTVSLDANTFTAAETRTYQVQVQASFVGEMNAIRIDVNGSLFQNITVTGQSSTTTTIPVPLTAGAVVTFFTVAGSIAALTAFQANFSSTVIEEVRTVRLSSCMPDKPVKEFLRGISHLFNLEWAVDAVLRKVITEPRFPYVIEGVYYPGFYDVTNLRKEVGQQQGSPISVSRVPGYQKSLEIGYKATYAGLADFFQNKQPDPNSIALNAVRFVDDTDLPVGSRSESRNPYFQPIVVARATYFGGSALPHMWKGQSNENANPESYDGFELGDADYAHEPSCAIVQRDGTFIEWEDINTPIRAPLLVQRYVQVVGSTPSTAMCLSYCDSGDTPGSEDQSTPFLPGLGSVFYAHMAASLLRGRIVTLSAAIPNPSAVYTETFRRGVALRYDGSCAYPSILLGIKGYQPGGIATLDYLTVVIANHIDNALTLHYGFSPILLGTVCDYAFQDELTANIGPNDGNVTAISLRNNYRLPLAYPYRSDAASEAVRLRNDLIRVLAVMGATHGAIACSINAGRQYTITIPSTNLQLATVTVQSLSELVRLDFARSNCA